MPLDAPAFPVLVGDRREVEVEEREIEGVSLALGASKPLRVRTVDGRGQSLGGVRVKIRAIDWADRRQGVQRIGSFTEADGSRVFDAPQILSGWVWATWAGMDGRAIPDQSAAGKPRVLIELTGYD